MVHWLTTILVHCQQVFLWHLVIRNIIKAVFLPSSCHAFVWAEARSTLASNVTSYLSAAGLTTIGRKNKVLAPLRQIVFFTWDNTQLFLWHYSNSALFPEGTRGCSSRNDSPPAGLQSEIYLWGILSVMTIWGFHWKKTSDSSWQTLTGTITRSDLTLQPLRCRVLS